MKYTVKDQNTNVLKMSQKLEHIQLKLRELKKEDAKCNSQIEKLNNHIEHLNISKNIMLDKINPSKTLQKSTLIR